MEILMRIVCNIDTVASELCSFSTQDVTKQPTIAKRAVAKFHLLNCLVRTAKSLSLHRSNCGIFLWLTPWLPETSGKKHVEVQETILHIVYVTRHLLVETKFFESRLVRKVPHEFYTVLMKLSLWTFTKSHRIIIIQNKTHVMRKPYLCQSPNKPFPYA